MQEFAFLSLLIWVPIVSGVMVLALGASNNPTTGKWMALTGSAAGLGLIIPVWFKFDIKQQEMQFEELVPWVDTLNINYHLGIDGISFVLIFLNCLTTFIVVVASWDLVVQRICQYLASFLILSGLINGAFSALDAVLFYVFFEATLIPMFIIIGVWGGVNRVYAALKFFLYTLTGSLLTLVALIYLFNASERSFSILDYHQLSLPIFEQVLIFGAFFAAFAVKIPMWPVHTWLPDAHVEAPTAGSVVLAAVLLKLGAYGFLRLSLPILPDASVMLSPVMIFLALTSIVYIGFVALVQPDMKKLIAYSSVSHMGFVTLGIFLLNVEGMMGAIIQLVSHGFISGALFLCIGVLYDRLHSREIGDFGGVVNTMPIFASFFMLFAMANAGLPGTSGFVGEFLVLMGAMKINFWYAFAAGITLVIGAAYTLWMYKRVMFGEIASPKIGALLDLNSREIIVLSISAFCILWMGVYPSSFTQFLHVTVDGLLSHVGNSKL